MSARLPRRSTDESIGLKNASRLVGARSREETVCPSGPRGAISLASIGSGTKPAIAFTETGWVTESTTDRRHRTGRKPGNALGRSSGLLGSLAEASQPVQGALASRTIILLQEVLLEPCNTPSEFGNTLVAPNFGDP